MHILKLLSDKKYVSGNEIAGKLSISRAAVHKQINRLKKNGFEILSCQKGYKLVKSGELFDESKVFSRLNKNISVCKTIFHYPKINSTQIKLKNLAMQNAPEGSVVIADEQSQGYGRMQRKWSSGNGGLWFSFLLKPKISPDEALKTALLVSVALNRVLRKEFGVQTLIKWPNDILFKGKKLAGKKLGKKLAGILIEMSAEYDRVHWVAAGIGVNVNNDFPLDLRQSSVSLKEITGKAAEKTLILASFFNEFNAIYSEFQNKGFKAFQSEYNSNLAFLGENIKIDNGYDIIKGTNKGIDENGRLAVRTKRGIEKAVSGTLRKA